MNWQVIRPQKELIRTNRAGQNYGSSITNTFCDKLSTLALWERSLISLATDLWLAYLPLSIRVQTTLLTSLCHAMPFPARVLKIKSELSSSFVGKEWDLGQRSRCLWHRRCTPLARSWSMFPQEILKMEVAKTCAPFFWAEMWCIKGSCLDLRILFYWTNINFLLTFWLTCI